MFDLRPESTRQPRRAAWQMGASVGVHALIMSGAVWATRSPAAVMPERTVGPAAMIPFVELAPDADRSAPPGGEPVIMARPARVIPVVTDLPGEIPPVATDAAPFDPADDAGRRHAGEITGLPPAADSARRLGVIITSAGADEAPVLLRAGRKVVPAGIAGVPAQVEVQFIIGTDGRVEADSVTVLKQHQPCL